MAIYDINFSSTHDMYLDGQDIAFATEDNVVRNRLAIRLQFILNEWFLDTAVGLPYPQFIFEQSSDLADVYSLFRNEITNTEGVDSIESLQLTPSPESKSLQIDFAVNKSTTIDSIEVTI
jgi:hypothetical protein